jgi:hypothetical protein
VGASFAGGPPGASCAQARSDDCSHQVHMSMSMTTVWGPRGCPAQGVGAAPAVLRHEQATLACALEPMLLRPLASQR